MLLKHTDDITPNNLLALETALLVALDNNISVRHIFNENNTTGSLISNPNSTTTWRSNN